MIACTKMNSIYTYKGIGGFCPNCHNFEPIGDVEVTMNINFRPDAKTEVVHINHTSLMNMESSKNNSFIEIICPECGSRMIQIDNDIAEAICNLNNSGFFTKASCDGGESYSKGYIQLYDIHSLIELFKRTDRYTELIFTVNDNPYLILKSKDENDRMMSLIFDIDLNAIRPLTANIYDVVKDFGIPSLVVCKNTHEFIDAVNDVTRRVPEWFDKFACRDFTSGMSLRQYIKYRNI